MELRKPDITIPIGSCIDVCCHNGLVYAIKSDDSPMSEIYDNEHEAMPYKKGDLIILEPSGDGGYGVKGVLGGLGNARQIELYGSFAYITARDNGLHIVDISDSAKPQLVCNYDTLEFATGVAVNGRYAAVCCRNFGVELLDISIPRAPKHLSVIRAGEVQSVFFSGNLLIAGSWGERKAVICDVSDAVHPKILSEIPLGGQGDGVFVENNWLYAVTGQDARGIKIQSENDPAFGRGNFLEIYDIENPRNPILLSRTELVEKFNICYIDMWDVCVSYPYAYVCHTYNGVFVYDISNPKAPYLLERCCPLLPDDAQFYEHAVSNLHGRPYVFSFDFRKEKYAPVAGIDVIEGELFMAGLLSDLHICKSEYFHAVEPEPKQSRISSCFYDYESDADIMTVRTHSQVHSVAWHRGKLYAACGNSGIEIFRYCSDGFENCSHIVTDGIAEHICFAGDLMLCSENSGGLTIRNADSGDIISRIDNGMSVKQVRVSKNLRFALAITGDTTVAVYDISSPENPKAVIRQREIPGLIYGRNITDRADDDIYGCFWNSNVLRWFDMSGEEVKMLDIEQRTTCSFPGGITCLGDGRVIMVSDGGYRVFDRTEVRQLQDIPLCRVSDDFNGNPVIYENTMIATERMSGKIHILDISDVYNPILKKSITILGNPDIATIVKLPDRKEIIAIPSGHQGIVFLDI